MNLRSFFADVRRGFVAPLHLLAKLKASPLFSRYRKVSAWQSVCVLTVAAIATSCSDDIEIHRDNFLHTSVVVVSTFIGSLFVAQWVVIALSNSYHEEIDVGLRALVGLPQEPPPRRPPAKRIHWDWIFWDVKNRWLGLIALVFGEILLSPLLLFGTTGDWLDAALLALWGFYWLTVFVAFVSSYSQAPPEDAPLPWWQRVLETLLTVPGFRWWLPRAFLRFWRRRLRPVQGPMQWVERQPRPLAGLSLARLVFGWPVVWLWVRPVFSAAVAEMLIEKGAVTGSERRPGSADAPARL